MLTGGGVRVPFIARWKGVLPEGEVYCEPVISLDVGATAVALAGLDHPEELDGVNLIPYLTGKKNGSPHDALYWRFWNQGAIRKGKWKYLQAGGKSQFLFDLTSPQHEKQNLIDSHPEIATELQQDLEKWAATLKTPGLSDEDLQGQEAGWYGHYFGSVSNPDLTPNDKPDKPARKPNLVEKAASVDAPQSRIKAKTKRIHAGIRKWREADKDSAAVVGDLLKKHTELAKAHKFEELEALCDKVLEILGETEKAPDVYGQEQLYEGRRTNHDIQTNEHTRSRFNALRRRRCCCRKCSSTGVEPAHFCQRKNRTCQPQSNLWFGTYDELKSWGPASAYGGPWVVDEVEANVPSDPFLMHGFDRCVLHLALGGQRHVASTDKGLRVSDQQPISHMPEILESLPRVTIPRGNWHQPTPAYSFTVNHPIATVTLSAARPTRPPVASGNVGFTLEIDTDGTGQWRKYTTIEVPADGYVFHVFPSGFAAQWIRIRTDKACVATAYFHLTDADYPDGSARDNRNLFAGLGEATAGEVHAALVYAAKRNRNLRVLSSDGRFFEFEKGTFHFHPDKPDAKLADLLQIKPVFAVDEASVIISQGNHCLRLPKGNVVFDKPFSSGWPRAIREVESERRLHGNRLADL